MPGELLHHDLHDHPHKPLVVRGGLGRTFGSLITFLALTLLVFGSYMLEDALAHPVEAYAPALITAAFAIALGLLMLFYLLRPRRIEGTRGSRSYFHASRSANPSNPVSRIRERKGDLRRDLAYQRIYVDHSRIRA